MLDLMKQYSLPMTRETYMELAYMGQPPEEIDPEVEVHLAELFGEQQ